MKALLRRTRGQTATEVMIVLSVVTIAVVAAAYAFVPKFRTGVRDLGGDVSDMLSTGRGGRRPAPAPLPNSLPNFGETGPFRLPNGPNAGCASGMACNPSTPASPLGQPLNVCRAGDRC